MKNSKKVFKIQNIGFGEKSLYQGDRLLKTNGEFNVNRSGYSFLGKIDLFYWLVNISWPIFFSLILLSYFVLNIFFAFVYLWVGIDQLSLSSDQGFWMNAWECFFYSTQTFTSVGYGRIAPVGFITNIVSSFEALIGLLFIAVATGLLYGRFSRPIANLLFSDQLLLTPHKGTTALMFRFMNKKQNTLTDVEVAIMLSIEDASIEPPIRRFYNLEPEYKKINFLSLNWTVVHSINESSPLANLTAADYATGKAEFIISVKAFDSTFSQQIQGRHSYSWHQIIEGYKFSRMYFPSEDGSGTKIYMDKISAIEKV